MAIDPQGDGDHQSAGLPNPKTARRRQWLWFVALWLGGLFCALALGYTIRFFMSMI